MKQIFLKLFLLLLISTSVRTNAQIKLGNNVNTINTSSLLELESTTKGLLFTRMTSAQMNALTAVKGLVIFNTDSNCLFNYSGTTWVSLCRTGNGQTLTYSQSGTTRNIGISSGNTIHFSVADNDSSTTNEIQTLNVSTGKGTIWLSNTGGIIKLDTSAWSTNGNSISSSATKFLGTTNNTDLVVRTNNTERLRVDSATGNVGLANNNPLTTLAIYGGLSIGKCDSITVTGDNQAVTVGNNSCIFLKSDNGTATNRTIVLSDGLVIGQILILVNIDRDAQDDLEVQDNSNTKLSGNWQADKDDCIILMWNGLDWVELAESAN